MSKSDDVYAIVPAAGSGKRMESDVPKQYLKVDDELVIVRTLSRILSHPRVTKIVVALSEEDDFFEKHVQPISEKYVSVIGGAERCHSVLAGARYLSQFAHDESLVMVHDAARPCVRCDDIAALVEKASQSKCGVVLGMPVRDTLKSCANDTTIKKTIDRSGLWQALTPQIFSLGLLIEALEAAIKDGHFVTDESQAMEYSGYKCEILEGHADNIKITRPSDLLMASVILKTQAEENRKNLV
ncbi:MAG: 2-C-methyl-D-erythritol 4-phosphate cytidylyltransferase [Gammaproteobacteria bacterium]|nr:2-C-methyl-D-erythritol 4-phosphate cytidylyltransferase [Gammaproteobacteria bacterium]